MKDNIFKKDEIFKIDLKDHDIDTSNFDKRNYGSARGPIDMVVVHIALFNKYNIVAYNVSISPGIHKAPLIWYDFCGELEDIRNFNDDYNENSNFYEEEIMKIVNSVPKGSAPKFVDLLANTPHVHSSSEFH